MVQGSVSFLSAPFCPLAAGKVQFGRAVLRQNATSGKALRSPQPLGLGFRDQGLGFRVQDLGFWVLHVEEMTQTQQRHGS